MPLPGTKCAGRGTKGMSCVKLVSVHPVVIGSKKPINKIKIYLIMLMYFGRVGGLTLVYAAVPEKSRYIARYPEEKINVG